MEQEVEATMVLTKKVKLRAATGQMLSGHMEVFESENPYVIVMLIETEYNHSLRADVHKEDLAYELRQWLEGKAIRYPAVLVPPRIDDSVNRFVKFGKTPLQEDLIMWILSRSELYLGKDAELVFGGKNIDSADEPDQEAKYIGPDGAPVDDNDNLQNDYDRNVLASMKADGTGDEQYRIQGAIGQGETLDFSMPGTGPRKPNFVRSKSIDRSADLGMFDMTRKMLGKSATLEMLKKKNIKGRADARAVLDMTGFTSEQHRLIQGIEVARKRIESKMDERRRLIEVAKTRQQQRSEKLMATRQTLKEAKDKNAIIGTAMYELQSLQRIEAEIQDDIRIQKNRAHRAAQRVAWTMAPPGFNNRRGQSQRGPKIGPGPLPPNATSGLKDPRVERAVQKHYWDAHGHRHKREGFEGPGVPTSSIEKALEAIRRAASNISLFKLDLKALFDEFDTSGDGFLSEMEMAEAFRAMGVHVDQQAMEALFKHFDPNGSGSVHYGEFQWAFFNRRKLVRQWSRNTKGLTEAQIRSKFHDADINGDGKLSPKEFQKLLKGFKLEMQPEELDLLMQRFDLDHDGFIDLNEFRSFIESEQLILEASRSGDTTALQQLNALPAPKGSSYVGKLQNDPTVAGKSKARTFMTIPGSSRGTNPRSSAGKSVTISDNGKMIKLGSAGGTYDESLNDKGEQSQSSIPTEQIDSDRGAMVPETVNIYPEVSDSPLDGNRTNEPHDAETGLDPLWMARILQAQAEVEARLGRRYYS